MADVLVGAPSKPKIQIVPVRGLPIVALVIGPILAKMSVQARMEFSARFMPKMLLIMPTLVTMTLASGWQLARLVGNLEVGYPKHWWLTASFIVVGVMAVIAIGILES